MHYLIRRGLTYLAVFLAVLNIVFILPRLAPGNAAEILASGTKLPQQAAIIIAQRFGLNQPIQAQYIAYLKNIFLSWPPYFGVSYGYYPTPVSTLFADRIGWTLLLLIGGVVVGNFATYLLGSILAFKRRGKYEIGSLYSAIMLNSIPSFWIAMIFLFVLAISYHFFPLSGNVSFNARPGTINYYVSVIEHAVLPVLVLSLSVLGQNYLMLRGAIQDVFKSEYLLTARLRGLSEWNISNSYVLRNSLLPFVSVLSFSTATMLSQLILIEYVFAYPGVGDLLVDAVLGRDYPVVEGTFFFFTVIVIIGGLIGDFLLMRLDPRLRS